MITREDDPADARGQIVALSRAGADILKKARVSHNANLRRWFSDRLEAEEADVITRALRRVRLGLPGGPESEAAMVWGNPSKSRSRPTAIDKPADPSEDPPGSEEPRLSGDDRMGRGGDLPVGQSTPAWSGA